MQILLDIALELLGVVIFLAIGVGILALLGQWETLKNQDPELLVFIGAVVVLAVFAAVFAVIAIVRRIKKKHQKEN